MTENKKGITSKETYNIVSDTVVGVNARKSDNLLQAKIIIITIIIGAIIGGIFSQDFLKNVIELKDSSGKTLLTGLGLGAFAGLILGFLGSGIYLMIFRAVKHASGKHD